jgi:hypothetical protein
VSLTTLQRAYGEYTTRLNANSLHSTEALVTELIACILSLPADKLGYSIQQWKLTSLLWKTPKAALHANA